MSDELTSALKDVGLNANLRPNSLDIRGQQPNLFPSDAFEFDDPNRTDEPVLSMKSPWSIDVGEINFSSLDSETQGLIEGASIIAEANSLSIQNNSGEISISADTIDIIARELNLEGEIINIRADKINLGDIDGDPTTLDAVMYIEGDTVNIDGKLFAGEGRFGTLEANSWEVFNTTIVNTSDFLTFAQANVPYQYNPPGSASTVNEGMRPFEGFVHVEYASGTIYEGPLESIVHWLTTTSENANAYFIDTESGLEKSVSTGGTYVDLAITLERGGYPVTLLGDLSSSTFGGTIGAETPIKYIEAEHMTAEGFHGYFTGEHYGAKHVTKHSGTGMAALNAAIASRGFAQGRYYSISGNVGAQGIASVYYYPSYESRVYMTNGTSLTTLTNWIIFI